MTVELATAYVSIVPTTKGLVKSVKADFDDGGVDKVAKDAGGRAGDRFAEGWGKKIAGAGLLTGAAAAGIGVGLVKIGASFDDAFDKLRVGTSAQGDQLAALQEQFKGLATTVPANFDDISTAMTGLTQRLGLTGAPLTDLSTEFLNLSRITGTDLRTNIDNATRLFGDWGVAVGDQGAVLDQLFRASQASGIGIDQLSQSLVQFGAPLRNLGFSLEQSQAMLALWNKTGVNTDTVVAGLKVGVGQLAKAGENVPQTFARVVAEIQKLGPGTEATKKAIELFGQRAGPDLADAIAGGKFAIGDMLKVITGGTDTINAAAGDTADFAEKWQTLKNRVFVALEPVATKFFGAVGSAMDRLGPIFTEVIGGLTAFQAAWSAADGDVTSSGFPGLMERLANLIRQRIVPALGSFISWLRELWQQHGPQVVAVLTTLFDGVKSGIEFLATHQTALIAFAAVVGGILVAAFVAWAVAAGAAAVSTIAAAAPIIAIGVLIGATAAAIIYAYTHWQFFHDVVDAVARFIADKLWPILKVVGEWLITDFAPAVAKVAEFLGVHFVANIRTAISWIEALWRGGVAAKDFLVGAFDAMVDFVAKLPGRLAAAAAGVWDWITAPFEAAMSTIRRLWNDTIGGFSFSIPDWIPIPGVAGKTFSVPKLHTGGFVPGTPGADIPILAQAGEYVLSRADVAAMAADVKTGPAPLIGTMVVDDRRPLLEQLVELQHLLPAT